VNSVRNGWGGLIRVRDLIARDGFSAPDSPGETPFLAGDQVRFRPRVGFHRLVAAVSLGLTALPVTASWRKTVKLADAAAWENVTNGSNTLDESVTVFADTAVEQGSAGTRLAADVLRCVAGVCSLDYPHGRFFLVAFSH
jgi:hypothetical protein